MLWKLEKILTHPCTFTYIYIPRPSFVYFFFGRLWCLLILGKSTKKNGCRPNRPIFHKSPSFTCFALTYLPKPWTSKNKEDSSLKLTNHKIPVVVVLSTPSYWKKICRGSLKKWLGFKCERIMLFGGCGAINSWNSWRTATKCRNLIALWHQIVLATFFPLKLQKNIKSKRLVFSSKRLQNPSKRPQKPANAYKSGKVCQMFLQFCRNAIFSPWRVGSQLKFDQTLDVVKQVFAGTVIWFANPKICARVRWLKFRCMSHDYPGRAQAIDFS